MHFTEQTFFRSDIYLTKHHHDQPEVVEDNIDHDRLYHHGLSPESEVR